MTTRSILFLGSLLGCLCLFSVLVPISDSVRLLSGITFIYLFSGYPLSLLVLPETESRLERIICSSGISLLLTYPAGFLNVLFEGQSAKAIFGWHLSGDLFFLFLLYLICTTIVIFSKHTRPPTKHHQRFAEYSWLILIPLCLSIFFNFYKLDWADQDSNEYDLGYQAYNLVDGIFAGRKAYVLSFNSHPPLPMFIQHYTMQILSPSGLETLSDWMYRFSPALLGVLVTVVVFLITDEITKSKKTAFLASSFMAVNTYHVFLSRIFQREMFLSFYLALAIYLLIRFCKTKSSQYLRLLGLFSGAALLVKETALILVPVVVITLIINRFKAKNVVYYLLIVFLLFSPVIIYNILAYLKTGYMDIFFANIFHAKTNPGATLRGTGVFGNFANLIAILIDQYGLYLSFGYLIGLLLALRQRQKNYNYILLLFVFFTILFVLISGVRPYYLPFLTLPLTIFLTKLPRFLLAVLFVYCFYYSMATFFNTKLQIPESYKEDYARSFTNLNKMHSNMARAYLENRNWKTVRSLIATKYLHSDCLNVDLSNHAVQLVRYFDINNQVKKFYIGANYQPKYAICAQAAHKYLGQWHLVVDNGDITAIYKR